MADQKITELPIKTSSGIAATDYLLGIDSAEGYQMLIQDLGDYILRNTSLADLATADKNVFDAINNSMNLKGTLSVPASLEAFFALTPGIYRINNWPSNDFLPYGYGVLEIVKNGSAIGVMRYSTMTNQVYTRAFNYRTNQWLGDWNLSTADDQEKIATNTYGRVGMLSGVNLDDMYTDDTCGVYWLNCNLTSITGTKPAGGGQGILFVKKQDSNYYRQIYISVTGTPVGVAVVRWYKVDATRWDTWQTTWLSINNSPHFATGTSSAGTLLATDTDINQLLTGEYYWASASYRPSANIPDNTAVRGRLWALDSGGQDIYCAQILYTSNFNWYIRYCTSKSSYTWTEWKQISGIPKQLSGITSLSDIPLGSNGYAQFDASVSPTGATAYFTYWCTGVNDRRSIIAVYTADSVAKAYVNVLHNSDGVTWKGWKSITLS